MLYILLRNAHWAVQSPQFKELHILFQDQYEFADSVFDEVAERIRTLGGQASIVPKELDDVTSLQPSPADLHKHSAPEILRRVAEDTERLIVHMREAIKKINERGDDQGTIDYLGSTLRAHEKHDWMIRAHLGV